MNISTRNLAVYKRPIGAILVYYDGSYANGSFHSFPKEQPQCHQVNSFFCKTL